MAAIAAVIAVKNASVFKVIPPAALPSTWGRAAVHGKGESRLFLSLGRFLL